MAKAYIGLGSNLGDRKSNICAAEERLEKHPEVRVIQVSSLYETTPVGFTEQPDFVNAVAEIETELSPIELLHAILEIENEMGRVREKRWGPRVIDIDLLIYDDVAIHTPELELPHPRMKEREFVMAPLAEIAPDLELDGETAEGVLRRVEGQGVRRVTEVG